MFYRQLYSFHRLLVELKAILSTPIRKLVIDDIVHIDWLTSNLDWETGHPTKVSVRRDSEAESLGKQVLALIVAEFDICSMSLTVLYRNHSALQFTDYRNLWMKWMNSIGIWCLSYIINWRRRFRFNYLQMQSWRCKVTEIEGTHCSHCMLQRQGSVVSDYDARDYNYGSSSNAYINEVFRSCEKLWPSYNFTGADIPHGSDYRYAIAIALEDS